MSIRRHEKTGDVILPGRPKSWEEFFRFRDMSIEADRQAFEKFLTDRKDETLKKSAFGRIKKLKTEDWTK